jgi:hypothetical protein
VPGPDENRRIEVKAEDGPYNMESLFCPTYPAWYCLAPLGPVNGIVYKLRDLKQNPRGYKIETLLNYRDGLPEGPVITFAPDGNIDFVRVFRNGVGEGLEITLFPSQGGNQQKIMILAEFKNDQLNGPAYRFNEAGNIIFSGEFRDNHMYGYATEYHPDGSVMSKALYGNAGELIGEMLTFPMGQRREAVPSFNQTELLNNTIEGVSQMMAEVPKIR